MEDASLPLPTFHLRSQRKDLLPLPLVHSGSAEKLFLSPFSCFYWRPLELDNSSLFKTVTLIGFSFSARQVCAFGRWGQGTSHMLCCHLAGETQNLRSRQVLMPHGLRKWMNHLSSNYCLLPTPSFCSSPRRPSLTRAPRRPENMDSQEGDSRGALYCTVGEWWVN